MVLYFPDHFNQDLQTLSLDHFLSDRLQNVVHFLPVLAGVSKLLVLFCDGLLDLLHVFLEDEAGFHGDDLELSGSV